MTALLVRVGSPLYFLSMQTYFWMPLLVLMSSMTVSEAGPAAGSLPCFYCGETATYGVAMLGGPLGAGANVGFKCVACSACFAALFPG